MNALEAIMTKHLIKGALAALILAGCGGEAMVNESIEQVKPEENLAGEQEIINGTVDHGHPTVGKVAYNGEGICTGTLVGAKTVVTAAHCIETPTASKFAFVLGSNSYQASAVKVHSGWDGDADGSEGINDIAVLILKNSPNVTPTPLAVSAPFVGEDLTLVGFGVTSENGQDYGTKRITTNNISKIASTKIYWMPAGGVGTTCYGDSGGPAFATVDGQEILVGVTSGGESPCETGYSWDTRVDLFTSWVSQVASGDVVEAGSNTPSCTPSCSNKQCGSDGCGGSCGTCGTGTSCNASFQCVSTSNDNNDGSTTESVSGSVAKSGSKYYGPYSVVAGSTFEVQMTGTGDADLYVRFGSRPTTSKYDCRPYLDGTAETCTVTVPSGKSSAYIMVRGYTASTFQLAITYTKPGSGSTSTGGTSTGSNGSVMSTSLDGSVEAGQSVSYDPITVASGSSFKVVMSGSGDADLYVRIGAAPTTSTYTCRPYLNGSDETCTVTVPAGQSKAYMMVKGYTAATYHLAVTYTAP
jgi:V8-like Glu-specific endopeptidase